MSIDVLTATGSVSPYVSPVKEVELKEPEFEPEKIEKKSKKMDDDKVLAQLDMEKAANQLNKLAKTFHRSVKFSVHNDTGRVMTKVVDSETNKTIREIPNEQVLDMIAKIKEYVGVVFDSTG